MKYEKLILSLAAALAVMLCPMAFAEDEADGDSPEDGAEASSTSSEEVSDSGFERYQSILDRQPFGPPPPGFDPSLPVGQSGGGGDAAGDGEKTEAEISAEEQKLMSSVRVSILNVTPSGTVMAGFTDSTTQPPVNYYLKVGDTSTDAAKWTVKAADPAAGTVTLAKDGVDVTLAVGGESTKGASSGKAAVPGKGPRLIAGPRGGRPSLRGRSLARQSEEAEGADGASEGGGALERLRRRRMMKHAEEVAQKQAADKARAELEAKEKEEREREREQAAAEREQQREALLQIQEELRRHREAKAAQKSEGEGDDPQE